MARCAAVLGGALLLGQVPAAGAPSATEALDLETLAQQSKTVEISEEHLRAALIAGNPEGVVFSTALDLGTGMTAIAWSECSKTSCRASLATLTGGTEHPRLVKRAQLVAPAKVFAGDGFAFDAPALTDLDNDGAPEIVVHYRVNEPPRPALGSLSHEYVAVYSPRTLALVFSHELRRAGGDSEDACQWTLERSGDRLIATGQCNKLACLETTASSCKPSRKLVETWRKPPGPRRYARARP